MSRIGRMPITVPAGVEVTIGDGNVVTVKGPKGSLTKTMNPAMTITCEDGTIHVTRPNDEKLNRSLHGLTRTLLHNMVIGVTEGYKKELEVNGVGYIVEKKGTRLVSSRLRSEGKDPPSLTRARVSNTPMRSFAARKARPAVKSNRRCA